jgi:hypothetical protein
MDLSHSFFSVFCVLNIYFLPHAALVAFRLGKFGEAFALVTQALTIYPNHTDSLELLASLKRKFSVLM